LTIPTQQSNQKISSSSAGYRGKVRPAEGLCLAHDYFLGFRQQRLHCRANDNRTIRKNLTLPSWLNDLAVKAGVNFSQVLQEGLKEKLDVQNR